MAKYNFKQIENIWVANGGSRKLAPTMAAIALAESGGYTQAHHTNSDGTVDQGLWQINSSNYRLYKGKNIYGIHENTHVAIRLANEGKGLGNWTTYKNGAYKKHLPSQGGGGGGITGALGGAASAVGGALGSGAHDIGSAGSSAIGFVTNPIGSLAGDAAHAVASPVEDALKWFGMRIVFALIIMGGGGLILLGLLLIGADLGLAAFAGAANSRTGNRAIGVATKITPAGRAAKAARATQAARATELHGQRVRMGEAKIKTQQARATELRTRTRHRAALAKQSKAQTERTQREAYLRGAGDAASPTMAKIRKQRKGKKAA